MVDKKLKRNDKRRKWDDTPASFEVVDQSVRIVVKSASEDRAKKLHFFGPKKRQGWPFVSVPLSRGNCMWGVLCVDSFESCGRGREDDEVPEPGVVDFIASAGSLLGSALDLKSKANTLSSLDDCTKDSALSMAKLWELAIFALRDNLRFATDISVLRLSRKPKMDSNNSYMQTNKKRNTRNSIVAPMMELSSIGSHVPSALTLEKKEKFPELILVVNLVRAFDLTKVRKFGKNNSYVTVSWGDVEMGRSRVVLNSLSPKFNDQIVITDVSEWESKTLMFRVWDSNVTSSDSIIGEFAISGGFLVHLRSLGKDVFPLKQNWSEKKSAPAGYLEAVLSLQVAEFAMPITTVIPPPTRVLKVKVCGAVGLAIADDSGSSDPYCVIYFDDVEIGRTPVIYETLNPIWMDCVYEVEAPEDALQSELVIDVYDWDEEGDHDFLGKVEISGSELSKPKLGKVSHVLQKDKDAEPAGGNGGLGLFGKSSAEDENQGINAGSSFDSTNKKQKVTKRTNKFVKGKIELEISYEFKSAPKVGTTHKTNKPNIAPLASSSSSSNHYNNATAAAAAGTSNHQPKRSSRRMDRNSLIEVASSMGLIMPDDIDFSTLEMKFINGIVNDESNLGFSRRRINGVRRSTIVGGHGFNAGGHQHKKDHEMIGNAIVDDFQGDTIQMSEKRRIELLNTCLIGRTSRALPCIVEEEEGEGTTKTKESVITTNQSKKPTKSAASSLFSNAMFSPLEPEKVKQKEEEAKDIQAEIEAKKVEKQLKDKQLIRIEKESFCGLWSEETILSPIKDISLSINNQIIGFDDGTDHVIVIRTKENKVYTEDEIFIDAVNTRVQSAVRCIRGRAMRQALRNQIATSVKHLCSQFTLPAGLRKYKGEKTAIERAGLWRSNQDDGKRGKVNNGTSMDIDFEEQNDQFEREMFQSATHDIFGSGGGISNSGDSANSNSSSHLKYAHSSNKKNNSENKEDRVTDIDSLFRVCLKKLSTSLPGANLYIALLQPGGNELKFVAATENSTMMGRTMKRGEGGVCFDCVGPHFKKKGIVVTENSSMLSRVRCFVEEDRLAKEREENANNANYNPDSTNTDDPVASSAFAANDVMRGGSGAGGKGIWPFIAVPLSNNGCSVGVLCCDDFSFVGRGREDEPHPEMGVMDMLLSAASSLGSAVDAGRKERTLADFYDTILFDASISAAWIYQSALRALISNSLFVDSAQVWRLDSNRQLSVASHFHANELSLMKLNAKGKHKKKDHKTSSSSPFAEMDASDIGNPDDEEDDENEYMELTVLQAKDLPKADVFGSSDPYVVVKWENDEDTDWDEEPLLVTDVVMDNLNPIWGDGSGETIVFAINPEMPQKDLVFEVYDWDRVGEHDLLGVARMSSETLLQLTQPLLELQLIDPEVDLEEEDNVHHNKAGKLYIELHVVDDEDEDDDDGDANGISNSGDGAMKLENQIVMKYGLLTKDMDLEATIVGCSDLAKIDHFGKSDVFCEVWFQGEMVFRTGRYPLDATFHNESMNLKVRSEHELIIDVYSGHKGKDSFLGEVIISGANLLHPSSEIVSLQLASKPGMPEKDQQHIQGSVSLKPRLLLAGRTRAPKMRALPHEMNPKQITSSPKPNSSKQGSRDAISTSVSNRKAMGSSVGGRSIFGMSGATSALSLKQRSRDVEEMPVVAVMLDEQAEYMRHEIEKSNQEDDENEDDDSVAISIENAEEVGIEKLENEQAHHQANDAASTVVAVSDSRPKSVKFADDQRSEKGSGLTITQTTQQPSKEAVAPSGTQGGVSQSEEDWDINSEEWGDSFQMASDGGAASNGGVFDYDATNAKAAQLVAAQKKEAEIAEAQRLIEIELAHQAISEVASGQLVDAWLRHSGLAHLPSEFNDRIFIPFTDKTSTVLLKQNNMSTIQEKSASVVNEEEDENDEEDDSLKNSDEEDELSLMFSGQGDAAKVARAAIANAKKLAKSLTLTSKEKEDQQGDDVVDSESGDENSRSTKKSKKHKRRHIKSATQYDNQQSFEEQSSLGSSSIHSQRTNATSATKAAARLTGLQGNVKKSVLDIGEKFAIVMNINETNPIALARLHKLQNNGESRPSTGASETSPPLALSQQQQQQSDPNSNGPHISAQVEINASAPTLVTGTDYATVNTSSVPTSPDSTGNALFGKDTPGEVAGGSVVSGGSISTTASSHHNVSPEALLGQGDAAYVKSLSQAMEIGLSVVAERLARKNARKKQIKLIKAFCQDITSFVTQDMFFGASKDVAATAEMTSLDGNENDHEEDTSALNNFDFDVMTKNEQKQAKKVGKDISLASVTWYVMGLIKKQLPKHWAVNTLVSMEGGEYLKHIASTDNTYVWAGQDLKRPDSILFDTFDYGYSMLVTSVNLHNLEQDEYVSPTTKQFYRRRSSRIQSGAAAAIASAGTDDGDDGGSGNKPYVTRVRIAPSTWSSGFVIGNLIEANLGSYVQPSAALTGSKFSSRRESMRRSSFSSSDGGYSPLMEPNSGGRVGNNPSPFKLSGAELSKSLTASFFEKNATNEDENPNKKKQNKGDVLFTFASQPEDLVDSGASTPNGTKLTASQRGRAGGLGARGKSLRSMKYSSFNRSMRIDEEEQFASNEATSLDSTKTSPVGFGSAGIDSNSSNSSITLNEFVSIKREAQLFKEKQKQCLKRKGHWGNLVEKQNETKNVGPGGNFDLDDVFDIDPDLTTLGQYSEDVLIGSKNNGGKESKTKKRRKKNTQKVKIDPNEVEEMEKKLRYHRKVEMMGDFLSAVPVVNNESKHQITDTSRTDYMAVPLATKGNLSVGVLTVRMIKPLRSGGGGGGGGDESPFSPPAFAHANSFASPARTGGGASFGMDELSNSLGGGMHSPLFQTQQSNFEELISNKAIKPKLLFEEWGIAKLDRLASVQNYELDRVRFIEKEKAEKLRKEKELEKLKAERMKIRSEKTNKLNQRKKQRDAKVADKLKFKQEKDNRRDKKMKRKLEMLKDNKRMAKGKKVNTTNKEGVNSEEGDDDDEIDNDMIAQTTTDDGGGEIITPEMREKASQMVKQLEGEISDLKREEKESEIDYKAFLDSENRVIDKLQAELQEYVDDSDDESESENDDDEESDNAGSKAGVSSEAASSEAIILNQGGKSKHSPQSSSLPTLNFISGYKNKSTGIPKKKYLESGFKVNTAPRYVNDDSSSTPTLFSKGFSQRSRRNTDSDDSYEIWEETLNEMSWDELTSWASNAECGDDSVPIGPDEMDPDLLDYLRSAGEVLGQTIDVMVKMQCVKDILGTVSALHEDDDDDAKESALQAARIEKLKRNNAYRNVIVVSIQDLYSKVKHLFMLAFPRLVSVEVWQLVGEGIKNFAQLLNHHMGEENGQEGEGNGEQPNILKLSQKSHLVLRNVLNSNEDEFVKPGTQPSGFIDWPKLALEEIDVKLRQHRGKPFKLQSGQLVIPITDPGPKGSYMPDNSTHDGSKQKERTKGSNEGRVTQNNVVRQPRRHAVVLRGDDRFPWSQDLAMMSYYAKVIEMHLFRIRRYQDRPKEGGQGKKTNDGLKRVLSADIQSDSEEDSSEEEVY